MIKIYINSVYIFVYLFVFEYDNTFIFLEEIEGEIVGVT